MAGDFFSEEPSFSVSDAQPLTHAFAAHIDAGLQLIASRDQQRSWASDTHRVGGLVDVLMTSLIQSVTLLADFEQRIQQLERAAQR